MALSWWKVSLLPLCFSLLCGCGGGLYVVNDVHVMNKTDGTMFTKNKNGELFIDVSSDEFTKLAAIASHTEAKEQKDSGSAASSQGTEGTAPVAGKSGTQDKYANLSPKQARNQILRSYIMLSDLRCEKHKGDILANAASLNVGFGTLTTILAGTATFAGGEGTKSVLAGTAAMANSERSLFNEEIYYNALAIAITRAIDLDRNSKRTALQQGMDKKTSEYSIDTGMMDALQYHNACSFMNGLKAISSAIEHRKLTKEELEDQFKFVETQLKQRESDKESASYKLLEKKKEMLEMQIISF
ncbi:hypothetical protein DSM101010T_30070 [Desulfovibrio subterraneus]|uniref:Lipoprotein n=2 Tax=Desulfovibrio subterraneus TaxID=2718620 RepID=A0A7J0BN70_9BACT|nr:hypothetical protein DSM101010T_30070 [Desulfovibrio subterraneus]